MLELTKAEAGLYLADLGEVLTHLSLALQAVARLTAHTPAGPPPNAMIDALVSSWESLDSRFSEVYAQLYGDNSTGDDPTYISAGSAEARLGQEEPQ